VFLEKSLVNAASNELVAAKSFHSHDDGATIYERKQSTSWLI
jgi:hypothetical protein